MIFDLFDTLLQKVWFDYDKALDYLAKEYFGNRKAELKKLAIEYRERFMLNRSETNIEKSFFDQLNFYEKGLGVSLSKSYDEIEWEAFSICRKEKVAEGAKETLSYFKERGYKICVLSNSIFSAKTLLRYLKEYKLDAFIDCVFSSADIKYRKPSIEAFDYVLNDIGEKANREIYFVGNKKDKDADGALYAGLTPILLSKEPVTYDGIVLPNLSSVKEAFESRYLYINSISEKESMVDGPGLRTVVYFQGCRRACHECHNRSTWSLAGGERYSVNELADIIKQKAKNKKVTFSGGEPLLQAKGVLSLIDALPNYDICLYTGATEKDVPKEIIDKLSYLKVGAYDKERRTTVVPFVGSTNQNFICLRGKK